MKKAFRTMGAVFCAAALAVSFAACGKSGSGQNNGEGNAANKVVELLGQSKKSESLTSADKPGEGFTALKQGAEAFASSFAPHAYGIADKGENFTVSPISVYMALALTAECAGGETRSEILSALGVSYEQLRSDYAYFFRSLEKEYKYDGEVKGLLDLTNSIWVNQDTTVKQACIDALANDYYADSYRADFKNRNADANKAIQDFVKEQTRGLIDQNFELTKDTAFALINTLYLKTCWGEEDLDFTAKEYKFTEADGTVKNQTFLEGNYGRGQVQEGETYRTFYTTTWQGYKLKFILPKTGHTAEEVFNAQTLAEVNAITDYKASEEYNKQVGDGRFPSIPTTRVYLTRCLFPEYECSYDGVVNDILSKEYGINKLFMPEVCDFSALTDTSSYCSKVQHVTELKVNKKGIEGAAVTIVADESTSVDENEYVYNDFVIDRAFGFIITDNQDVTLFSGIVNKI